MFGQASGLLHGVLVQHARCAEHGEAVHVAAAEHALAAHADASAPGTQVVHADATAAEEHGHEHCLGVWNRRGATFAPEAGTVVPALFAAHVHAAPHAIPRVAARPLFLLAPKTSPPV